MTLRTEKYLVAFLSLSLFAALLVVGLVDARRRAVPRTAATNLPPGPVDPIVNQGRQLYEKLSCIACHGADGGGGVRNLNAQTGGMINGLQSVSETYSKEELVKKILDGVPVVEKADPGQPRPPLNMPAYRELLPEEDLTALVTYLFSLRPAAGQKKEEAW